MAAVFGFLVAYSALLVMAPVFTIRVTGVFLALCVFLGLAGLALWAIAYGLLSAF